MSDRERLLGLGEDDKNFQADRTGGSSEREKLLDQKKIEKEKLAHDVERFEREFKTILDQWKTTTSIELRTFQFGYSEKAIKVIEKVLGVDSGKAFPIDSVQRLRGLKGETYQMYVSPTSNPGILYIEGYQFNNNKREWETNSSAVYINPELVKHDDLAEYKEKFSRALVQQ